MTMSGPLSEAIGMAVLHLLWQGVIVAALLALALRLLTRSTANVRYAASCIALASLVILGVVTARSAYEPASTTMTTTEPSVLVLTEVGEANPSLMAKLAVMTRIHSSTIALTWLAGVLLLAGRLAFTWTRTRGLVRNTAPAEDAWQDVLAQLSAKLNVRRVVRLVESAAVDVPSVVGFLKPVVLVPATSLSGLSARQLEMILAHELAHIRRHDYLANVLQSVAETLLFFHPAAWWISRQIRIERENCCDDLAVGTCGNAVEYARALTILEELRDRPALAVAASGGSLLDRVKRLIGPSERRVNGWTALAALLSFAVVMAITSLPLQALDPDVPPPPPAPPAVPAPMPMPAPRIQPVIAGTPVPAIAPLPPMAVVAASDFDMDFDYDLEPDEFEETESGRLSIDELIALKIHGVTPQYANEMRGVFGTLRIRDLTHMKAMGVTAKYIADMRAAGVDITTAKEAVSLRAMDVSPELVRSLAAAGYTKLSVRDLTRLAAAGVNADFIREVSKYREKQ